MTRPVDGRARSGPPSARPGLVVPGLPVTALAPQYLYLKAWSAPKESFFVGHNPPSSTPLAAISSSSSTSLDSAAMRACSASHRFCLEIKSIRRTYNPSNQSPRLILSFGLQSSPHLFPSSFPLPLLSTLPDLPKESIPSSGPPFILLLHLKQRIRLDCSSP